MKTLLWAANCLGVLEIALRLLFPVYTIEFVPVTLISFGFAMVAPPAAVVSLLFGHSAGLKRARFLALSVTPSLLLILSYPAHRLSAHVSFVFRERAIYERDVQRLSATELPRTFELISRNESYTIVGRRSEDGTVAIMFGHLGAVPRSGYLYVSDDRATNIAFEDLRIRGKITTNWYRFSISE